MKQLLFSVLIGMAGISGHAQSAPINLPSSTLIPHYRLAVGYNSTTVLVFAAAVRPVDRGDRDILAIKQPGVENVLKVKAAHRNFLPTNLHVFTADGRLYAFDVSYTDSLASSRDLTALLPVKDSCAFYPDIVLTGQAINDAELLTIVKQLHESPGGRSLAGVRHERMTLVLDRIGQRNDLLFLRLRLCNRSALRYALDFIRCYIRDKQQTRRTSIQEQELAIPWRDSVSVIGGHAVRTIVIAVPLFTLANGKEGIIEIHEKNGGRSLALHLHNRILLKARPL